MYIWTAIDIESQLNEVKRKIKEIENNVGIIDSVVNLPLHVSLKISFETDESISSYIIKTITDYYMDTASFDFSPLCIEKEGTIVWIRMQDNETLSRIHDDLVKILLDKFSIIPHKFDLEYKFHTTLFMDTSVEKISSAYEQIKGISLPEKMFAKRFVMGTSPSGAPGTYKVCKYIEI